MGRTIFHLVAADAFAAARSRGQYRPDSLDAEGFVHCAPDPEVTLEVARAYFSRVEGEVLVLAISVERLESPCVDEAAAPPDGRAHAHHRSGRLFPHVYGPINESAISGVAVLARTDEGYAWPTLFSALTEPVSGPSSGRPAPT